MLKTNKTAYTAEDLRLTAEFQNDSCARIAQSFLQEVFAAPYLGHNASRFKSLLLALYNSNAHPLDLQTLGALRPELLGQALELISRCLKDHQEPHSYFENGTLLFSQILPKWGAPQKYHQASGFNQQQFLRDALKTLKLTREQLSETLGCSKRGLDKWLLPTESQDFRPMGALAVNQVKALLQMGPVAQTVLSPETGVRAMGLACKAFALLGRERIEVNASLSLDKPDGLKDFGDFQKVLVMAYLEGVSNRQPSPLQD